MKGILDVIQRNLLDEEKIVSEICHNDSYGMIDDKDFIVTVKVKIEKGTDMRRALSVITGIQAIGFFVRYGTIHWEGRAVTSTWKTTPENGVKGWGENGV